MQIKVTMEEALDYLQAAPAIESETIPLAGAYKLNKIRKQIETESAYYTEKFREIVDKYAIRDANGNWAYADQAEDNIAIQPDKVEQCNKEIAELNAIEVEINNYDLTIDNFGDIQISADDFSALMPFLNE